MSESTFDATGAGGSTTAGSGTASGVKDEAAKVASTAGDQAGQVAHTAADEAKTVAREVKSQTRDLYAQTRDELRDQAGAQQQRVASGLQALAGELGSMADRSDEPGLGTDLVREVSARAEKIGTWLGDRDPGSLLDEVKSFARRRPGVFIGAAALAGLVAGRLTRALAQDASDGGSDGASSAVPPRPSTPRPAYTQPTEPLGGEHGLPGAGGATPVYDQATGSQLPPVAGTPGSAPGAAPGRSMGGDRDDRPHAL